MTARTARQRQRLVADLTAYELAFRPPTTQDGWCLTAARISIMASGMPRNDLDYIYWAESSALGLFGEAFEKADDYQRWGWIDMCERALRQAAREYDRSSRRKQR